MTKKSPFKLPLLPPRISLENVVSSIGKANHALGKLNGLLVGLKNPELLITPLLTKEAVLSSRIEGTQASLEDVFHYEAASKQSEDNELERDIREIINYRKAMGVALAELNKRPISENFIKKLHKVLLDSVRGSAKDKGNFRKIQVFIGKQGATIEQATFIPPGANDIPKLIANWEKYLHEHEEEALVKNAVLHYQFEAIHPFLDGNGRVGRLLIPLILYNQGLLNHPVLYISEYFERDRASYYALLKNVSENNAWEEWIEFFLDGITAQSRETEATILKILTLHEELKDEITGFGSQYAFKFLDLIFATPVFSFVSVKDRLGAKANQTVYDLIDKFTAANIIREFDERKRNREFEFPALLKLLR